MIGNILTTHFNEALAVLMMLWPLVPVAVLLFMFDD